MEQDIFQSNSTKNIWSLVDNNLIESECENKYSHLIKPVQVRLERISENTCSSKNNLSAPSFEVDTELKAKPSTIVTKDCFVLLKDLNDSLPLNKLDFVNDIDKFKNSKESQYDEVSEETRNNFTYKKPSVVLVNENIMQHTKVEFKLQLESDDSNLNEGFLDDATSEKVFDLEHNDCLKNATIKESSDSKASAIGSTIDKNSSVHAALLSVKLEYCDRKDEVQLTQEILKRNAVVSLKRLITPFEIPSPRHPKKRGRPFGKYVPKKVTTDVDNSGPRVKRVCRDESTVLGLPVARFKRPRSASSVKKRLMKDTPDVKKARQRFRRCNSCKGCLKENCKKCVFCLDMRKYGGPNVLRQACKTRKCMNPVVPDSITILRPPVMMIPDKTRSRKSVNVYQKILTKYFGVGKFMNQRRKLGSESSKSKLVTNEYDTRFKAYLKSLSLLKGKEIDKSVITNRLFIRRLKKRNEKLGITQLENEMLMKVTSPKLGCVRPYLKRNSEDDVWVDGLSLISDKPISLLASCYLCGSVGLEDLIYCASCCEPFHTFCLNASEVPNIDNAHNWCCRKCQYCSICGLPFKLITCCVCQSAFHPDCLGLEYFLNSNSKVNWCCNSCARCEICGSNVNIQQNSMNSIEMLCESCIQTSNDNQCSVCGKYVMRSSNILKALKCMLCDNYVHLKCDNISDDMFNIAQGLINQYTCSKCSSDELLLWRINVLSGLNLRLKESLVTFLNIIESRHDFRLKFLSSSSIKNINNTFVKEENKLIYCKLSLEKVWVKLQNREYISVTNFMQDVLETIDLDKQLAYVKWEELVKVLVKCISTLLPWWESPESSDKKESVLFNNFDINTSDHNYAKSYLDFLSLNFVPQPSVYSSENSDECNKEGASLRICVLCSATEEEYYKLGGRLLYCGKDDWIHTNCAIWSSGVTEIGNGTLKGVYSAISKSSKTICSNCGKLGATVKCSEPDCKVSYHFTCATRTKASFWKGRIMLCSDHKSDSLNRSPEINTKRKVIIDINETCDYKKCWKTDVESSAVTILSGSLKVENLGEVCNSSCYDSCLVPINYSCSRIFWSTKHPRKRVVYRCRTLLIIPEPEEQETEENVTIHHLDENTQIYQSWVNKKQLCETIEGDETLVYFPNDTMSSEQVKDASTNTTESECEVLSLNDSLASPSTIDVCANNTSVTNNELFYVKPTLKSDYSCYDNCCQQSNDKKSQNTCRTCKCYIEKLPNRLLSKCVSYRRCLNNNESQKFEEFNNNSNDELPVPKLNESLESLAANESANYREFCGRGSLSKSCRFEDKNGDLTICMRQNLPLSTRNDNATSLVSKGWSKYNSLINYKKKSEIVEFNDLQAVDENGWIEESPLVLDSYHGVEHLTYSLNNDVTPQSSLQLPIEAQTDSYSSSTYHQNFVELNNERDESAICDKSSRENVSTTNIQHSINPLKCPKCRRLYKTEASLQRHIQTCDFEISSSEDDENDVSSSNVKNRLSQLSENVESNKKNSSSLMAKYPTVNDFVDVTNAVEPPLANLQSQSLENFTNSPLLQNDCSTFVIPNGLIQNDVSPLLNTLPLPQFNFSPTSIYQPTVIPVIQENVPSVTYINNQQFISVEKNLATSLHPADSVQLSVISSMPVFQPSVYQTNQLSVVDSSLISSLPQLSTACFVQNEEQMPEFVQQPVYQLVNQFEIPQQPVQYLPEPTYLLTVNVVSPQSSVNVQNNVDLNVAYIAQTKNFEMASNDGFINCSSTVQSRHEASTQTNDIGAEVILQQNECDCHNSSVSNQNENSKTLWSSNLAESFDTEATSSQPLSSVVPHIEFEITSDDGFHLQSDNIDDAWKKIAELVQRQRSAMKCRRLSIDGINGLKMIGVTHNAVRYCLEQLPGARQCKNVKLFYHEGKAPIDFLYNPSGCARTEKYKSRRCGSFHRFGYRRQTLPGENCEKDNDETSFKISRRSVNSGASKPNLKESVSVFRSNIHGLGLLAKRTVEAGEQLMEYCGEVIRSIVADKREKYYESKGIGCYMFRIDDKEVIDATIYGNAARFINHSCEPNCFSKVITIDNKKHIGIFALRRIAYGEELTYDYKFPIEEVKIPCTCGSRKCRRFLN